MKLGLFVAAVVFAAACSSNRVPYVESAAYERSVTITTTACGHASRTVGTGVIIESGVVLTAAHVVIGATDFLIADGRPAVLTRLDAERDLATLAVTTPEFDLVRFGSLDDGQAAIVATAAHSEPVVVTIDRHATLSIDDVRGQARHNRGGYLLSGRIAGGDSGAGLFDGENLAGVVFAVASDGESITYAIDSAEIVAFLATSETTRYECDPESSRVKAKREPAE